jgi:hypothetical protein
MKTFLIRKPSVSKTNQPSWQQAIQSSLTWDSRRLSHGLTWWGSTTFVFACIDSLFSCQMLLSSGPNSRSAHLFAIFGFSNSCAPRSNFWVSSVQTRRRAQVIRDFMILQFCRSYVMICGLRAYKRVGAHKSCAIL